MKKVEIVEVTKYGWECPDCGTWNESDEDNMFFCDECYFEVERNEE